MWAIDGCALVSANFELSGFTKVASRASLLLSQLPNSCIPARLLSHSNFPSQLAAFQGGTSSPVVDLFLSIQWQTGGWFPWDFSIWSWQKVHLRLPTAVALQQLGPGRISTGDTVMGVSEKIRKVMGPDHPLITLWLCQNSYWTWP